MMNFEDIENFVKLNAHFQDDAPKPHGLYPEDIDKQCDISSLSPDQKNQSEFDSASFLSVGANEMELFS